jgi:hypothetical protein
MVMTKQELIASFQNEVRILLHLASKIDRAALDYRPTPKQRTTLELLRYLSMMGPTLLHYVTSGSQDPAVWTSAEQAAQARDFDQTIDAIAAQRETYAALLAGISDDDFRAEAGPMAPGTTRGAMIVNQILGSCIAYRMQLFLYLKASGAAELNTWNLWQGIDQPAAVA